MDFSKLLRSNAGRILISIILGLGISSLFRRECKDLECINFKGPSEEDIKDKLFRFNEKCFSISPRAATCDGNKKMIPLK